MSRRGAKTAQNVKKIFRVTVMYTIGYDVGSSSIKAALFDCVNGNAKYKATFPKTEMAIIAAKPDWAEQHPGTWWDAAVSATKEILAESKVDPADIKAIGISYQMHGLVVVDKDQEVLRPSIIWCDSRAVEIGDKAFNEVGQEVCLQKLLNSPGNFTAAKLKWVKDNEPEIYGKIYKFMLPGDYIAMKLTGEITTTTGGISEGILWDFSEDSVADFMLKYFGFDKSLVPAVVPVFGNQGELTSKAAAELGLKPGIKVTYRTGDQPNNAFSLNVLNPGDIASTAGTSGVVYGISGSVKYDPQTRVNTFVHVNHTKEHGRYGILLCVNGTGISYSWIKKMIGDTSLSYEAMNKLASGIEIGSNGLNFIGFGNGAERLLGNKNPGAFLSNINFNVHTKAHLIRAIIEGVAFSFKYGVDILKTLDINPKVINAGNANMFLSPIFRDTLSSLTGVSINLYDTDGAVGAARGAAVGAGIYKSFEEAFSGLKKINVVEPDKNNLNKYQSAYENWLAELNLHLKNE